MEGINFKRDLIEYFMKVSKGSERFPQETLTDVDTLVENIKKVDPEKGEIIQEFIQGVSTHLFSKILAFFQQCV